MATALCWSHVVILPRLVWLGRPPLWRDLLTVAAGGAIVGLLTATAMRLFSNVAVAVSPKRAMLGASVGPLLLILSTSDAETNSGGLAGMIGAGVVASLATCPRWRSSWPGARACWALLAAAVVAVAGPNWVFQEQHVQASRAAEEAKQLRCAVGPVPDCLADAAYALQKRQHKPWIKQRETPDLDLRVARALARAGHAEQARDLVRWSDVADREDVAVWAEAGQVALAARARPDLAADLAPLERLGSPVATSKGLSALAAALLGRVEPSYHDPILNTLPVTVAGAATLRAAADRWQTLLPSLIGKDVNTARIGLARLLTDLGEGGAAARVLDPIRMDKAMNARDWLQAGDGEMALLVGARTGKGELAAVATAATGLVKRQGGPGTDFRGLFRGTFAPLLAPEASRRNSWTALDARAFIGVLWRLGEVEQARAFADEMADRSRALGIANEYALAAASYMDIGENERAGSLIDEATATLPTDALTCFEARLNKPVLNACSPEDITEKGRWFRLAVQMHRLGRPMTGFRPAISDKYVYQSLLTEELLATGFPPAQVSDVSNQVRSSDLLRIAFIRCAESDVEGARSLLASLAVEWRLQSYEALPAARLAAALGDHDLQLAFLSNLLTHLRVAVSSSVNDAVQSAAATAVYWRENLSDTTAAAALR